jgi:two-component system chemotaxis response regulator CheY
VTESARVHVLIVEDSATMRGFVTAALESGGEYQVTQAKSGFEALKMLPRGQYDLIISDINMPDINGLELVRFIRDSDKHARTPLILISTDNRPADVERGMKLGANAYLTKPFLPEDLVKMVREVMNGKPAA